MEQVERNSRFQKQAGRGARLLSNYAVNFYKQYVVQQMGDRAKLIVDGTMSCDYLLTRDRDTYHFYRCIEKLLVKNRGLLELLQMLEEHETFAQVSWCIASCKIRF